MKNKILIILSFSLVWCSKLSAQLERLFVETYYVAGEKDTLDPLEGHLEEGSVTYRVFADLEEGYALKSIIGDPRHPVIVQSTKSFFNHPSGDEYGSSINPFFFSYGTIALDSWLSIGFATANHLGIPKESDPDTSVFNSSEFLAHEDESAGRPISIADGLVEPDSSAEKYRIHSTISDSTFSSNKKSRLFLFNDSTGKTDGIIVESSVGAVSGKDKENMVLVAQLTTKGELSFKLNLEVISLTDFDAWGKNTSYYYYATDTLLDPKKNQHYNRWLSFPLICGCTDPYFAEYTPEAVCDDGSCSDSIRLGCMDNAACNYDPTANFDVREICCYGPDNCDERDIKLVCPEYSEKISFSLSPNPANEQFRLTINELFEPTKAKYSIIDPYGKRICGNSLDNIYRNMDAEIDINKLKKGLYIIEVTTQNGYSTREMLIKK